MPQSPTILPPLVGWTKGKYKRFFEEQALDLAVKAIKSYQSAFHDVIRAAMPEGGRRVADLSTGWWYTTHEHLDAIVAQLGNNVSKVTFRHTK